MIDPASYLLWLVMRKVAAYHYDPWFIADNLRDCLPERYQLREWGKHDADWDERNLRSKQELQEGKLHLDRVFVKEGLIRDLQSRSDKAIGEFGGDRRIAKRRSPTALSGEGDRSTHSGVVRT